MFNFYSDSASDAAAAHLMILIGKDLTSTASPLKTTTFGGGALREDEAGDFGFNTLVLSAAHADSPGKFSLPMFGGVPPELVTPEAYSNRLQLTHASLVEKIQAVGRARLESAILANRVSVDGVLHAYQMRSHAERHIGIAGRPLGKPHDTACASVGVPRSVEVPNSMGSYPRSYVIGLPTYFCPAIVPFTSECPPLECNLPHSGALPASCALSPASDSRHLTRCRATFPPKGVIMSGMSQFRVHLCENVWKRSHSLGVSLCDVTN